MTSSCLLGVHHAMFAKTAGNEIEAIGSWDEVKWLAASGWRRLTTWSRSICHLKSHPWNLKWLEKFKKFSAWDNFWGVDEMKCCSTYSSVPLYQLTWKSWPPQQHPLFAPPLLLCSFAHWFLCFWGNKVELCITISSCSGHVQAHIAESHFSSEDFEHYWVYGFCSYLPGLVTVWIAPVGCW